MEHDYPKLGVMYDFRLPAGSGRWSDVVDEVLQDCEQLDEAGVDSLWVTEHHFTEDAYLPSLLPMAAALAARTSRCDVGTCVLLAPLHHPLAIAESAAVVDNIAGGRFILGMGLGYRQAELDAFAVPKSERGSRMTETVEILLRAWSPEPLTFEGRHWTFADVDVQPKPFQRPHPRLWLAARSVPAATRAGTYATGVIAVGERLVVDTFREAAAEKGRDPADLFVATTRSWIAPDLIDPDQLTRASEGLDWRSARYKRWYAEAADLPGDRTFSSGGTATEAAFRDLDTELAELRRMAQDGTNTVIYHGTVPGLAPSRLLGQWQALIEATR